MSAPTAKKLNDRETTAERLLRSSVQNSYEPSGALGRGPPRRDGQYRHGTGTPRSSTASTASCRSACPSTARTCGTG